MQSPGADRNQMKKLKHESLNRRRTIIKVKNGLKSLAAAALLVGVALSFNACSEHSPLQSTTDKTTATRRAPGELKILKSKFGVSLNKLFVKEKLITVDEGGKVEVGDDEHGKSRLKFEEGDVSQDVLVRFEWESTGLLQGGAEFSPHGTTFNNPVKIRLSYKDADLTGVNEDDLEIRYYNEVTGEWEFIGNEVNTSKKVVIGYTDHFSRYAIGAE